jgi:hypothetical protein
MSNNWQSDPKRIAEILEQIRTAGCEVEVDAEAGRVRAAGKGFTFSLPYPAGDEASLLAALAGKLGGPLER